MHGNTVVYAWQYGREFCQLARDGGSERHAACIGTSFFASVDLCGDTILNDAK